MLPQLKTFSFQSPPLHPLCIRDSSCQFFLARQPPVGQDLLIHEVFLITQNTLGRTPLDEWSARRRDLYLTTHDTHSRKSSIYLAGFEPIISASKWPQTDALVRTAIGTGHVTLLFLNLKLPVQYLETSCHTRRVPHSTRVSGRLAPLIHTLSSRWRRVVEFTTMLLYPSENTPT